MEYSEEPRKYLIEFLVNQWLKVRVFEAPASDPVEKEKCERDVLKVNGDVLLAQNAIWVELLRVTDICSEMMEFEVDNNETNDFALDY